MGANEILPSRQPLPEAGLYRRGESLDFAARGSESHQAAHPRHLLDLGDVPLGAGVGHSGHATIVGNIVAHLRFHAFRSRRPCSDDALLPFLIGHHAQHIVFLEVSHLVGSFGEDFRLVRRHLQVVDGNGNARLGGVVETQLLDAVQRPRRRLVVVQPFVQLPRELRQCPPVHQLVLEINHRRQRFVENQPPHGGFHLAFGAGNAVDFDSLPQVNVAGGVGNPRFVRIIEIFAAALTACVLREVVAPHHHIQVGRHQRIPGGRRQHIVDAQHYRPRFVHRHGRQRHVHRHLVAVKVGVERRTHQRVQLNGAALNQHRLERLDAQPVQSRRPVEHHRPVFNHILQNRPHLRRRPFHHPLGRPDVRRQRIVHQPVHHKGFEQLQRHPLGQPAFVHLQLRPHHNDRPARVVHPLAQQVLPEPPLFALQQIAQRLQLVVALALHGLALPSVVNQRVHRFL